MACNNTNLLPGFLEVQQSVEYGRGIYSKKIIQPGETLLKAKPLCHVVSTSESRQRCGWCLERNQSVRRCSNCKLIRYCSRPCQRADWLQHRLECKGLARITPNVPTDTMRLLVRLLTRRTSELLKGIQWELDMLESKSPGYSEELKTSLSDQVLGAKLLLGDEKDKHMTVFDAEIAFDIACKLMSNSFNILDEELNNVGGGVYCIPGLVNHSCDPNCIVMFTGNELILRCIREVKKGEQILISYVDLLYPGDRRRRQLYKCYQFICKCSRCSSESMEGSIDRLLSSTATAMTDADIKLKLSQGYKLLDQAEELKKLNDWPGLLRLTSEFLRLEENRLGGMNVLIVRMRECFLDACIELSKWKEALEMALALQPAFDKYYHMYNPLNGIHYFKMAKLMHQVSDTTSNLETSLSLLEKAEGILTVTHGHTHKLVTESRGLLRDVQAELALRKPTF